MKRDYCVEVNWLGLIVAAVLIGIGRWSSWLLVVLGLLMVLVDVIVMLTEHLKRCETDEREKAEAELEGFRKGSQGSVGI